MKFVQYRTTIHWDSILSEKDYREHVWSYVPVAVRWPISPLPPKAPRIAIMKVTIAWPVRPCDVAQRYQGFEGNCYIKQLLSYELGL